MSIRAARGQQHEDAYPSPAVELLDREVDCGLEDALAAERLNHLPMA